MKQKNAKPSLGKHFPAKQSLLQPHHFSSAHFLFRFTFFLDVLQLAGLNTAWNPGTLRIVHARIGRDSEELSPSSLSMTVRGEDCRTEPLSGLL